MSLARKLTALAAVAAAALIILMVTTGGSDAYRATLLLDNAAGLRPGSTVVVGGIAVGKIDLDVDQRTGKVRVDLNIDRKHAPIGRDASAQVIAQNLLGQKRLSLNPGNPSDAAPSGFTIPAERVTVATDLDQLLSTLDSPTRTRLAVFINELGTGFTGRRVDFNKLLRDLGPALGQGGTLLQELSTQTGELRTLLTRSDRYVAELTAQREGLYRLVDDVGQTATTVAARRGQLRQTLASAPEALTALQGTLDELERTTIPLGPAARQLSATAPSLQRALEALPGFTDAARPTLDEATRVAPALSRLAKGATPVLRQAVPAVRQLRTTVSRDLPGVTSTLDGSINNTLAILENWSRAIQYRDAMSHIFRGESSFAPDGLNSVLDRLVLQQADGDGIGRARPHRRDAATRPATPAPAPRPIAPAAPAPKLPLLGDVDLRPLIGGLGDTVGKTEQGIRDTVGKLAPPAADKPLLDYLLGN